MQLSPRYRIHISTELLKKSDIFQNIYTYTLFGIFYMFAKSHESINGRYEHKQTPKIYNSTFLIPAYFCTMKENDANFFPGLFQVLHYCSLVFHSRKSFIMHQLYKI
jgi:hypothetical protein